MEKFVIFLKRYSSFIVYAGLIALIAALASYIMTQQIDTVVQGLALLGTALLILYIVVESGRVRTSLTGRTARYGTNSVLMTAAFIGIMVMLNVLSVNHYRRWDVTATQQFSVSEQTIGILKGLQEPIKVTGFFSTQNQYEVQSADALRNLLTSFQAYTDKLSFQFVDPDVKPGLARQYGITSYGTVVFERGDKRQLTTTVDEQSLTSALLKVARDRIKGVYFLTGHKEHDPNDDTDMGYSLAKGYLEKNNYKVGAINFTITNTVPSDMDVLVIASPQTPLPEQEVKIIGGYLQNGGKVLFMADPGVVDPFGGLLASAGLAMRDDMVIDPASSFPQDPTAVIVNNYDFPAITKGVAGQISFLPGARSLTKAEGVTKTLTVSPILQSSTASWGQTDYRTATQLKSNPAKDAPGPLALAMAVTSSNNKSRVVAFGDSELVTNGALKAVRGVANVDLFAGAVNWLGEEEDLISIPPKAPDQRFMMIPPGSSRLIIFASLILLPLVVIIAGVAVWWSRR